jgi:hypothetical protein
MSPAPVWKDPLSGSYTAFRLPDDNVTSLTVSIPIDQVVVVAEGATGTPDLPGVTRLHNPAPNPFNPTTKVSLDLARDSVVHLRVYDLAGRLVRSTVR